MKKQTRKEYHSDLLELHKKYTELRNCGNADHLTNDDGSFKPSFPKTPGTISIGYLEEACQWTFYRKDITDEVKLQKLTILENIIQQLLGGINYIPTWSKKLNNPPVT